jgi:hypothetical protein
MERSRSRPARSHELVARRFAIHGAIGLVLIAVFWIVNWNLEGPRSHWAFFPLWLGYSLTVDALVLYRTGTSLLTRSWRKYVGLFLVSAPAWWLFELLNAHLQNWRYTGVESFSDFKFFAWSTLSFTTVIPAVFGAAELVSSFHWVRRLGKGPVISSEGRTPLAFFIAGWVMLVLMLAWPRVFFPFIWLSIYFILEPVNVWLGNRSLADWTREGDWRLLVALWVGVLITAFFWEMWNVNSYPKWVYSVPWGGGFKIFEMPLLGYGGYLPFALELYALYHLVAGLLGQKRTDYVKLADMERD